MNEQIDSVTFVLTSCNRFDLLELTLKSFLKYNAYPIHEYVIIEDSPNIKKLNEVLDRFDGVNFTVINNDPQIGQLPSIDKAYSHVKTEYIFHCEDDWEFYQSGFIEKSLAILKEEEKIITVWLREQTDTNNHPIEPKVFRTKKGNVRYKLMRTGYKDIFHGFTFNPGLRRKADYELLSPFSQFNDEEDICPLYYDKYYFRGAILLKGSVKHIGDHRKIRYKFDEKEWVKNASHRYKRAKAAVCKVLNI